MTRRSAHVYPLDRVFFTPSSTTSSSPAEQGIRSNTSSTTTAMSLKERVSQRLGRFLSIKYDRHHHHRHHHHLRNNDSSLQQPQQSNTTTTSNHVAATTTTIKQTYDATPHLYNRHHASMPLTSKDMGVDGTNDDCYYRQDDQPISSSLQMPVLPTALRPPPRPHYHHNRRAAIQQPFNDRCKSATVIMFGANSHFDIVRNDIAAKDGDDEDDDRHSFVTSLEQVESEQEEDDDEDDLYPQQKVAMSVTILPAAMAAATAARSRRYRARAAKAAAAAAYL